MHSILAVSELGVPLGVVAQRVWVGAEAERRANVFEDKESDKWGAGAG
ncbi:MAG TPA: hypothetical protein PLD47_18715 [Aggregatilineales bacterium]|nr:hypothetical protein [Anaerolineales bacterium]HRE49763.1 hypothetical protein [Aggregatilineales bacterium]